MADYTNMSDEELAVFYTKGDEMAYSEIYNRYWAILYRYARKLLQDDDEARDVIQDIFVMLWSKSTDLKIYSSLSSFLYAATRNRILKAFEKNKVHSRYLNSLEDYTDQICNVTDSKLRENELAARIEFEIQLLPPKMRKVFELSRKSHFQYKDIALTLDISENTVRKQVSNALKILRVRLGSLVLIAVMFI